MFKKERKEILDLYLLLYLPFNAMRLKEFTIFVQYESFFHCIVKSNKNILFILCIILRNHVSVYVTLKNVVLRLILWRNKLQRIRKFLAIISSYLRKLISGLLKVTSLKVKSIDFIPVFKYTHWKKVSSNKTPREFLESFWKF